MTQYTIKNVTEDLAFLMTLTGIFGVDDKYFWTDTGKDNARFKYHLDDNDTPKEIVLFQDPYPKGDYYYFNPFAEGLGSKAPADILYYRSIRTAFNSNLQLAMMHVIDNVLEVKADAKKELDPTVLRMASVSIDRKTSFADLVDDKLKEEFQRIFDRVGLDMVTIAYYPNKMTAIFMCSVFDDKQWVEKFGADIRKKSITAFKALLLSVLGVESEKDLREFDTKYDPKTKSAAKLDTTLNTYLKLYSKFNDVLNENFAIDLGGLMEVIERLPMAYAIAKHMVQPTLPKHSANDIRPADTNRFAAPSNPGGNRFAPEVVQNNGYGYHPGRAPNAPATGSRFAPEVLSQPQRDPFAPVVNMDNGGAMPFGGGIPQQGNYGYFGGGSPLGGYNNGINMTPPTNFGRPEVQRQYFR